MIASFKISGKIKIIANHDLVDLRYIGFNSFNDFNRKKYV